MTFLLFLSGCGTEKEFIEDPVDLEFCSSTQIDDQFIVKWKDGSVTVEQATDRDEFFDKIMLDNEDAIESVENDHRITITPPITTPPDQISDKLSASEGAVNWGIERIEAEAVWQQNAKGQGIIVAVVDSGAEVDHSQLRDQLYINKAEAAGEAGVDDDGNGFIDDISGYDFVSKTGFVTEVLIESSHGTHVAGIIAAKHVGDDRVKGVAPEAKILPLNFMDSGAGGTLGNAILAINYAVSRGAHIINASWGSSSCSSILENRIAALRDDNVLFVTAAGNSGTDISVFPEFPAAYAFSHQITVGASSENDIRAGFSNRSSDLVHLLAPGVGILSTVAFDDAQPSKRGTSMAAPFVSGVAAVLMSSNPLATVSQIKDAILLSVDTPDTIKGGDALTRGRLNLRKAYNFLNGTSL